MPNARLTAIAFLGAAAIAAAGCGGGSSHGGGGGSSTPASSSGGLSVKSTSLGKILTDSSGRTLYLFEKDSGAKSACAGACAANWPPFTAASKPAVSGGASSSDIKLVARSGGKEQVTYAGHPLYYFSGDQSPGQLNGQGVDAFGAEWYVLSPAGSKVEGKASSGGGSSSSSRGGYGGY